MFKPNILDTSSLEALAVSVSKELERLSVELSQPSDYYALDTKYAQPKRIFEGMIVKADGTTWNPGSGAGVYCYRGGAWRFLG